MSRAIAALWLILAVSLMVGFGIAYAITERDGLALVAVIAFGAALWRLDVLEGIA